MSQSEARNALKARRKMRIRQRITGTGERPRLSVFRSQRHVYAQVIDDSSGKTLASVGSFKKGKAERAGREVCEALGKQLAERCLGLKITHVAFDRNGSLYHGRIKAFADGARAGGLTF